MIIKMRMTIDKNHISLIYVYKVVEDVIFNELIIMNPIAHIISNRGDSIKSSFLDGCVVEKRCISISKFIQLVRDFIA